MFDSVQVRFKNAKHHPSPFANTRVVPFVGSYFEILKAVVEDVNTEYFWFFANFVDLSKDFDLDYIPEQHENSQIHVWYASHPMAGLNEEGNIMLVPTEAFKQQMHKIKYLRDFKDINYHANPDVYQQTIGTTSFGLDDPLASYDKNCFYRWLINKDIQHVKVPDFYPSFWEDVKLYTWGRTNDIMLVPGGFEIQQFYDIPRRVHFEMDYPVNDLDIVFISYDEPGAGKRFETLKDRFPRAKWSKGIKGQTLAYMAAAAMSKTRYFFAVFPKIDLCDDFDFSYQPDRLRNPCHYIFDCHNEVIDCTYGHDGVILWNKRLVQQTTDPGLDFTLSKPCTSVPILSAINKLDETPLMAWRTAFREVIKLQLQKITVETNYRLKKWTTMGKGKNAEWVHRGAMDAMKFVENKENPYLSYDFEWIKNFFEKKYG